MKTLILTQNLVSQGIFCPSHVPNFKEFGCKVGPSFLEENYLFSTPIQDIYLDVFARLTTSIFDQSWK